MAEERGLCFTRIVICFAFFGIPLAEKGMRREKTFDGAGRRRAVRSNQNERGRGQILVSERLRLEIGHFGRGQGGAACPP